MCSLLEAQPKSVEPWMPQGTISREALGRLQNQKLLHKVDSLTATVAPGATLERDRLLQAL